MTSFPPVLVKRAKFAVTGRYENPFPATPALYNFGELISTDLWVERLMIDNFSPKSENTRISSSFDPNATKVTLVVPEVGFVMLAEKEGFVVEKTRILSEEPTRIRVDDSDQKNQEIEAASSGGRDITRVISRDRVARMLSLEGRTVAMYAPSGLGRD
jgi:hypothetical protein